MDVEPPGPPLVPIHHEAPLAGRGTENVEAGRILRFIKVAICPKQIFVDQSSVLIIETVSIQSHRALINMPVIPSIGHKLVLKRDVSEREPGVLERRDFQHTGGKLVDVVVDRIIFDQLVSRRRPSRYLGLNDEDIQALREKVRRSTEPVCTATR